MNKMLVWIGLIVLILGLIGAVVAYQADSIFETDNDEVGDTQMMYVYAAVGVLVLGVIIFLAGLMLGGAEGAVEYGEDEYGDEYDEEVVENCPECGAEIDDLEAVDCPECGAPLPEPEYEDEEDGEEESEEEVGDEEAAGEEEEFSDEEPAEEEEEEEEEEDTSF